MRVTFEHREVPVGTIKRTVHFYVDCTVVFSEEEKAIIRYRAMGGYSLNVGPSIPPDSGIAGASDAFAVLFLIPRLLIFAGVIAVLSSIFAKTNEALPFLFWALAAVIVLYRHSQTKKHEVAQTDQTISLDRLITNPRFTVFCSDALVANVAEKDIHSQLTGLKKLMTLTVDPPEPKRTVEL
jgi:hypothetical protein